MDLKTITLFILRLMTNAIHNEFAIEILRFCWLDFDFMKHNFIVIHFLSLVLLKLCFRVMNNVLFI